MTLHALLQYIGYKWRAKTRHGIHSPFVYAFVDDVLRKPGRHFAVDIVTYFHCKQIHFWGAKGKTYDAIAKTIPNIEVHVINTSEEIEKLPQPDLIWIDDVPPEKWLSIYKAYKSNLPPNAIIAISKIHATPQHTQSWQKLCSDTDIRMSIDTYNAGLLLFRKEFKERQHFVVQAKAL